MHLAIVRHLAWHAGSHWHPSQDTCRARPRTARTLRGRRCQTRQEGPGAAKRSPPDAGHLAPGGKPPAARLVRGGPTTSPRPARMPGRAHHPNDSGQESSPPNHERPPGKHHEPGRSRACRAQPRAIAHRSRLGVPSWCPCRARFHTSTSRQDAPGANACPCMTPDTFTPARCGQRPAWRVEPSERLRPRTLPSAERRPHQHHRTRHAAWWPDSQHPSGRNCP